MDSSYIINIFTHDREKGLWDLLNSIDQENQSIIDINIFKDGSQIKYSDKFYGLEDTGKFIIHESDENLGIGYQKEKCRKIMLTTEAEHIFYLEDDVKIEDNIVWEFCIDFAFETGLKHFNWNNYRKNVLKGEEMINGYDISIHKNAEASFSYFHRGTIDSFFFDINYKNALEHGDVEYQLFHAGYCLPMWNSASPTELGLYLVMTECESSICDREDYHENVKKSFEYWESKWGVSVNKTPDMGVSRSKIQLKSIHKKHGNYVKPKKSRKKPNPVSIIVTIKDRCLIKYDKDMLLKPEMARMLHHDNMITQTFSNNNGMGIIHNQILISNKEGFRPFDHFLQSLNTQCHNFKGNTELIVVDWGSKDDDVEFLVDTLFDGSSKVIKIPYEEKFSRGFALDLGVKEAKYDRIHFTDIDMIYHSNTPLEIASSLNGTAHFPIVIKEMTPSALMHYSEGAGFGICSMEKDTYKKTGGYIDKRSWGDEDVDMWKKCNDILGKENIIRKMDTTLVHQWHSQSFAFDPK